MANHTKGRIKRPYGSGSPLRTIAIDKTLADRLYDLADTLSLTGTALAGQAIKEFLDSFESNPTVVKKLALKAKWDQHFASMSRIEDEMKELDAPNGHALKKRRKKGQHRRDTPRYTNGFAVDGSSMSAAHAKH